MIGLVWAAATTLASPALRAMLRYRASRGKELAARLPERRGIERSARPPGTLLWLHAASVGETVSVLPVLASLSGTAQDRMVLLTTGTVTSARLLEQRLPGMDLPMRVLHRFAPLDVPSWVTRFLDHWRPDAAGFVESEIWPNIVSACGARGIPIILINARMSARSYTAWSRVPWAARFTLRKFTRIHARSEEDALRLRALGAERVEVVGDLKRSTGVLPVDPIQLRAFSELFGRRPVFVAASTHPGEEIQIKAAHDALRQRHSDLLTIIAPRHPERGEELARLLHAPRRQLGEMPPHHGLWIADTLGELGLWYRLADVSFIGRSLIPPGGGQNPLEPARLGCAVAVGAFTSNFTDHVALLGAANAIEVVADLQALIQFVDAMLMDPRARWRVGQRAKAAVRGPDSPQDNVARTLLELIRRG